MKRQFQMKPSQGNGDPVQAAHASDAYQWPPNQGQPGVPHTPMPFPQESPALPQSGIMAAPQSGIVASPQSGIVTPPQSGIVTPPQSGIVTPPQSGIMGQNWQSGNPSSYSGVPAPSFPKKPVTDPLFNDGNMQGFFPGHGSSQQARPAAAPYPAAQPGGRPGPAPQWGQPDQPAQPAAFAPSGAPPMQRPVPSQQQPGSLVLPSPTQMPGNFQNGAGYYASAPAAPARPANPGVPRSPQYSSGTFQQQMGPPAAPPTPIMPPRWVEPESPPSRKGRKRRKQRRIGRVIAGVLLAIMSIVLLIGGVGYWYYQTNFASAVTSITGHAAIHQYKGSSANTTPSATLSANQSAMLTGNRVNILILGSDTDGKGNDINNGTPLAQTDIVITIDPQTNYVAMLSIPRDMQVTDPVSGGHTKLDVVFENGYSGKTVADKVASAAGRAMDTIEYNYGIHIDHYAWVGLDGFVKVINTAGGVDVDAIHPMVDDTYPDDTGSGTSNIFAYKRLYIAPGPQHMDGLQALDYVRTRHSDLIGDFGRSARQQQLLTSLKAKLATTDSIAKAPQLLQDVQGSVETDLTLDQLYPLANFARTMDTNKMQRVTLSPPYATPSSTNSNYLPVCDKITTQIATMFNLGSQAKCIPQTATADNGSTPTTAVASAKPATTTTTQVASVSTTVPVPATSATADMAMTNAWQMLGQFGSLNAFNLQQVGQGFRGIEAIHDILDIMFLATFESFDAMKV